MRECEEFRINVPTNLPEAVTLGRSRRASRLHPWTWLCPSASCGHLWWCPYYRTVHRFSECSWCTVEEVSYILVRLTEMTRKVIWISTREMKRESNIGPHCKLIMQKTHLGWKSRVKILFLATRTIFRKSLKVALVVHFTIDQYLLTGAILWKLGAYHP